MIRNSKGHLGHRNNNDAWSHSFVPRLYPVGTCITVLPAHHFSFSGFLEEDGESTVDKTTHRMVKMFQAAREELKDKHESDS